MWCVWSVVIEEDRMLSDAQVALISAQHEVRTVAYCNSIRMHRNTEKTSNSEYAVRERFRAEELGTVLSRLIV